MLHIAGETAVAAAALGMRDAMVLATRGTSARNSGSMRMVICTSFDIIASTEPR